MAIIANYKNGAFDIKNAYISLYRIWLSKEEGFNAWVRVHSSKENTIPVTYFNVHIEYVEGKNPFTALYEHVATLNFLSDVINDNVPPVDDSIIKPRSKSKK